MKSILEGREGLKAVVYQIAEVTGYLWQKGWAERNGGNITVNVTEFMDDECKAMKPISEVKQIGIIARVRASECVTSPRNLCRTVALSASWTIALLTR